MFKLNAMSGNEGIKYAELREQVDKLSNGDKKMLTIFDDLKALDKDNDGKVSDQELTQSGVKLKLADFLKTVNDYSKDNEIREKLKNVASNIENFVDNVKTQDENIKESQKSKENIDNNVKKSINFGLDGDSSDVNTFETEIELRRKLINLKQNQINSLQEQLENDKNDIKKNAKKNINFGLENSSDVNTFDLENKLKSIQDKQTKIKQLQDEIDNLMNNE